MSLAHPAQAQHELSISRLIDAPPAKVFRAWTEPQWLMQWWGPHGMTTPECEMQLWAGGLFRTLMRAPDGSEYPNQGVFLEIAAPRRLVFTDAFGPGWVPSDKAFMTAVMMPFSFSITEGIAVGFISYCVMKAGTGRWREINPCVLVVALLFVLKFVWVDSH